MPNTTLFVREGRIVGMASDGSVPESANVTETVDLSGRYVIPGLINAHGHVSGLWADNAEEKPRLERARSETHTSQRLHRNCRSELCARRRDYLLLYGPRAWVLLLMLEFLGLDYAGPCAMGRRHRTVKGEGG